MYDSAAMPGRVRDPAADHSPPLSPPASRGSSISPAPGLGTRRRRSSVTSDLAGHTHAAMEHLKRSSIPGVSHLTGRHHSKERKSSSSPSRRPPRLSNEISLTVESPPNIFYGHPDSSSGALFSGRLRVHVVTAPQITVDTFSMQLIARITARKPVVKDCPDCMHKQTELHRWKFLSEPKHLTSGDHEFPFSHLIPGHLPTTTHGQLGVLQYFLHAKATTRHGEELTLKHPVQLCRAISPSPEKTSQRIFPPMDLTVHASFSPIIHPIGRFEVLMRIANVSEKPEDRAKRPEALTLDNYHRWRLRKMTWRLEETERMVSPACSKHAGKVGGEGKGIAHEETRTLARADMKDGWKSDFDAGEIDMEFSVSAAASPRPLCDVESPTGLRISHALVIELVIAEEWAKCKKPEAATPTGAARVLRATFGMIVTERAGLGVSWDEEQPPMYEDVPMSPPQYGGRASEISSYTGPPLDAMEGLNLGEPRRPAPAMVAPSHRGENGRRSSEEGTVSEVARPAPLRPSAHLCPTHPPTHPSPLHQHTDSER